MKSGPTWPDPNADQTWINNNWNGAGPDGSGEIWHYKIDANANCTASDGTCVWDNYEIVQSQGVIDGEHIQDVQVPAGGYGNDQ
jgi:hypothetical protein